MIYKYQRIVTDGPNGTTYYFKNAEGDIKATELALVDDWYYVNVPAECVLPDQHTEINFQEVVLDNILKESIKANSRVCQLIDAEIQNKIRAKYSLEDEQYFARIGVGVALGMYTFLPGEQELLVKFATDVEDIRTWGRDQRALVGL